MSNNTTWIVITLLTLLCSDVKASNEEKVKFEARAGAQHDLSHSNTHPRLGNIPILNRKVIKGYRVKIREHPYVVSVRRKYSHYISGAIISRSLVVTVAHPIYKVPITELGIASGENYSDRGSLLMTIVLVVIHPGFDPFSLLNDISLLRTYEEFSYRSAVKPIKIISSSVSLHGYKAFVTGWGRCDNMGTELCLARTSRYFPNEKLDPMMRTISFTIVHPHERCNDYKRYEIPLHPGMLCLGESRRDNHACPCMASPGAVLVTDSKLLGVQSWGFGCGYLADLPLVYTDMQYYSSWLYQNIFQLRSIRQQNLTSLFQATKAAILSEWLYETRVIKPRIMYRSDTSLERLDLDLSLIKINGSVYDIRNFISNGAYHRDKEAMYHHLRLIMETELEKLSKHINYTFDLDSRAFLGRDAMKLVFNTDNLSSNITASYVEDQSDKECVYYEEKDNMSDESAQDQSDEKHPITKKNLRRD